MRDLNRQLLLAGARVLQPMLEELVFVGGCATGLLITDNALPSVRATIDIDAIADVTSYAEYNRLAERLRALGFVEDSSEQAPLCRWRHGDLILDVMPLNQEILGFSNRWYGEAVHSAEVVTLEPSLSIRRISAPLFLATKLEAFKGRGQQDYFASHDLEDLLSVIDGRPELLSEVGQSSQDVRDYLAHELGVLSRDPRFIDALPGHMPPDAASQARIPRLLKTIHDLTY